MLAKFTTKMKEMPLGVRASLAYTICSVLQRCFSFITMPLFTRLLSTEQYGQYNVYLSWSSILTIFITLNLASGSFSTAMIKFEDHRKEYIAAIQNITVVLASIFLVVYFLFEEGLTRFFELPAPLVCLMVAEILATFALGCTNGHRRFEFKYKSVVFITLLIAVASPTLGYLFVINSEERGYARIVGYALVMIAIGLVLFIDNAIRGKGGFKKEYWKYALTFNIPLIPYYLSQVIFNQSDRIMISHMSGTDKAGMYSVAYTLATVLVFVLNAINDSYVPWFYGKIKEGRSEDNRNMANGIALLMAVLLLGVIALSPEIILIMAGSAYAEAIWVVPPVAMSILLLFYSQLFINVEFYYEEKTMLVWGSIGAAVLNIVLNALLIPAFGFVAAGYTTLLSYVVFAVTNYFTMKIVLRKREVVNNFFDLPTLLGIFVGFAALSFAVMALYRLWIIRYAIVVLVLLVMGINYKKVIEFVKSVLIRK